MNSRKSNDVISSAKILCECASEILTKANEYSTQFDQKDLETSSRLEELKQKIEALTESFPPPTPPTPQKSENPHLSTIPEEDENGKLDQVKKYSV